MILGKEFSSQTIVEEINVAKNVGSGDLEVFATPAMIALMENAAMLCVKEDLAEGATTVGTMINVTHSRASKKGAKITATARLCGVDGRRLTFELFATDSQGEIGRGVHERFIVDRVKFIAKIN